ncbi:MAG: hypothetical protein Faunusvirus5_1, partial [Faunusvirus sp.]
IFDRYEVTHTTHDKNGVHYTDAGKQQYDEYVDSRKRWQD